jgi:hypothetical protein
MSDTHSAPITQNLLLFQNRFKQFNIPQYHILILAWSALVILYGEPGPSRFIRNSARKIGLGKTI